MVKIIGLYQTGSAKGIPAGANAKTVGGHRTLLTALTDHSFKILNAAILVGNLNSHWNSPST